MDIVYIRDLRIDAVIGIYEWEQRIHQQISVNLEMGWDNRKAAKSDDIKDTLNPKKMQEIGMVSPLNLSVKEGRLFVCQGQVGVQIFDLTQTPVVPIYTNTTTDCFYNQVSDDNRVFMSTNYGIVQLEKNETSYSHLNTIY